MTHILESWEDFIEYAGFCRYGAYQIVGENGKGKRYAWFT